MNQLATVSQHGHEFRQSTDAAHMCGAIVKQTASNIQGRKYVSVEGWQAIAIAHGCAAGSRDVQKVEGGVRAIGEVRRMDDGQLIATAEGFVGEDEPTWYGGKNKWGKEQPKRPDYAIRAMAQTRAISRACRSAFAHVVVMIDAGLSTTPAEEVPDGGFIEGQFEERQVSPVEPATPTEEKPKRQPAHSALKTRLRGFVHELHGCGDGDELSAFLATPDAIAIIADTREKLPHLWDGDDWPEGIERPEEFVPLADVITKRQRECAEATAAYIGAG
jgi:hypothetical protein